MLQNKNGWFEIGVSYSFTSRSVGQGMGNRIFWSEMVTGMKGACAHLHLISFESIPPKLSGSTVSSWLLLLPELLCPFLASFHSIGESSLTCTFVKAGMPSCNSLLPNRIGKSVQK